MISPLHPGAYASAAAFHTALEARLRQAAGGDAHRLGLMHTQFAISRLLVRLQSAQPREWVRERWPTAEAALAVAKPLVDPALAGEARGSWDPVAVSWRD